MLLTSFSYGRHTCQKGADQKNQSKNSHFKYKEIEEDLKF